MLLLFVIAAAALLIAGSTSVVAHHKDGHENGAEGGGNAQDDDSASASDGDQKRPHDDRQNPEAQNNNDRGKPHDPKNEQQPGPQGQNDKKWSPPGKSGERAKETSVAEQTKGPGSGVNVPQASEDQPVNVPEAPQEHATSSAPETPADPPQSDEQAKQTPPAAARPADGQDGHTPTEPAPPVDRIDEDPAVAPAPSHVEVETPRDVKSPGSEDPAEAPTVPDPEETVLQDDPDDPDDPRTSQGTAGSPGSGSSSGGPPLQSDQIQQYFSTHHGEVQGISFTYWIDGNTLHVLADPVDADGDFSRLPRYEWVWGDGTTTIGDAYETHTYDEAVEQAIVIVNRLGEDDLVTHEGIQWVDLTFYRFTNGDPSPFPANVIALDGRGHARDSRPMTSDIGELIEKAPAPSLFPLLGLVAVLACLRRRR